MTNIIRAILAVIFIASAGALAIAIVLYPEYWVRYEIAFLLEIAAAYVLIREIRRNS